MITREICPACRSLEKEGCFVVNEHYILRCLSCGTMYVENLPTSEALAAIYTSDIYYELSADSIQRIIAENRRRLKVIQGIRSSGKFLDIGCAQGLLLDQAKQARYSTFGVEPTKKNSEVATAKGHILFNGWLADFAVSAGSQRFDVITCLDVIEHVDDPESFLKLALSLLAEDGLMVVSTPNYSGFIAKLLGARDPYMTPPEHITFFTSDGLIQLAANCGLRVISFHSFGSLIPAEMSRCIQRYVPKKIQFLAPLIRRFVHFSFWVMNRMKVGLEQEIYFAKTAYK